MGNDVLWWRRLIVADVEDTGRLARDRGHDGARDIVDMDAVEDLSRL